MRRKAWPLAALAMIAVIAVGCGDGSGGSSSAVGGRSTTAGHNSTAREKAVKFAACMREHGYPDFPDPKASGEFPSFGISVTPEVWVSALRACKDLQPPGSFSGHRTPEQQAAALRFAQCIRAHGVNDFPDPVNGDPVVDTTIIPSANRPGGMTILKAAMQKCGSVVRDALGGGSEGGSGVGG